MIMAQEALRHAASVDAELQDLQQKYIKQFEQLEAKEALVHARLAGPDPDLLGTVTPTSKINCSFVNKIKMKVKCN